MKTSALTVATFVALTAFSRPTKAGSILTVSLPGKSWDLQVDAPGFKIKSNETKPGPQQYLLAENASSGLSLSITLTQVNGAANPEDCWNVFRQRIKDSKFKRTDVQESQIGEMAVSEFIIPEVNGAPIQQKNVFGCLAKDDVYVDLHLSKVQFKRSDQALFTSILKGVSFADRDKTTGSALYWQEGGQFFLSGQYDKAIIPYRRAFDLEKNDRKLDAKAWRILIDNLGMAYGITGDLKSAEEVLQYGISKDPMYPLFYYNMACVSAERNDLKNTMSYLSTAFRYKENRVAGEQMPEPAKDDSFQRFMQNEEFRRLIDSLK